MAQHKLANYCTYMYTYDIFSNRLAFSFTNWQESHCSLHIVLNAMEPHQKKPKRGPYSKWLAVEPTRTEQSPVEEVAEV